MSVKSTTFGSVRLTGKDAEKFKRQVARSRPSAAAVESYRVGKRLSTEFNTTGSVKFTIKPKREIK